MCGRAGRIPARDGVLFSRPEAGQPAAKLKLSKDYVRFGHASQGSARHSLSRKGSAGVPRGAPPLGTRGKAGPPVPSPEVSGSRETRKRGGTAGAGPGE
jgi:hypothetical protein